MPQIQVSWQWASPILVSTCVCPDLNSHVTCVTFFFSIPKLRISLHTSSFLEGCNHIEKIVLKKCNYLNDDALPLLSVLSDSLRHLEIINCWNLTSDGILYIIVGE